MTPFLVSFISILVAVTAPPTGSDYEDSLAVATEWVKGRLLPDKEILPDISYFGARVGPSSLLSNASLRGHVAVLELFVPNSEPRYRTSMEALEALYRRHSREGLMVVGLADDTNELHAADFVKEHKITFPVLFEKNSEIQDTVEATHFPVYVADSPLLFLLGPDGRIIRVGVGSAQLEEFEAAVEAALDALRRRKH